MQKSEAAVAAAKARMGGEEPAYQYPPVYLLDKSGAVSNSAAADEAAKDAGAAGRYHPVLWHRRSHHQCDPWPLGHPL